MKVMVMVRAERFEMRLDSGLLDEVDKWRATQADSPSRAEAVRRLLEFALGGALREETQLSRKDRLMFWLLTDILKNQVDPSKAKDGSEDVDFLREVLLGGHFWALDWDWNGIMHSHTDDREVLSFVVETLDMWSFIERSFEALSAKAQKALCEAANMAGEKPEFHGFDGNHEGEYRSIAKFMIEKMSRFEEFKGRTLNTHTERVPNYRAMLAVFEPIRKELVGRKLSAEELSSILAAY